MARADNPFIAPTPAATTPSPGNQSFVTQNNRISPSAPNTTPPKVLTTTRNDNPFSTGATIKPASTAPVYGPPAPTLQPVKPLTLGQRISHAVQSTPEFINKNIIGGAVGVLGGTVAALASPLLYTIDRGLGRSNKRAMSDVLGTVKETFKKAQGAGAAAIPSTVSTIGESVKTGIAVGQGYVGVVTNNPKLQQKLYNRAAQKLKEYTTNATSVTGQAPPTNQEIGAMLQTKAGRLVAAGAIDFDLYILASTARAVKSTLFDNHYKFVSKKEVLPPQETVNEDGSVSMRPISEPPKGFSRRPMYNQSKWYSVDEYLNEAPTGSHPTNLVRVTPTDNGSLVFDYFRYGNAFSRVPSRVTGVPLDRLTTGNNAPLADQLLGITTNDLTALGQQAKGDKFLGTMIDEAVKNPTNVHIIRGAQGQPIGLFNYEMLGQNAYVKDIGLLPEFRGKGIGTQVIDKFFLDNPDIKGIAGFAPPNSDAVTFWKHMGADFADPAGGKFELPRASVNGVNLQGNISPANIVSEITASTTPGKQYEGMPGVYKPDGSLSVNMAQGRINDIAEKLDVAYPAKFVGDEFRASVDPNNVPSFDFLKTKALEVLKSIQAAPTLEPVDVPSISPTGGITPAIGQAGLTLAQTLSETPQVAPGAPTAPGAIGVENQPPSPAVGAPALAGGNIINETQPLTGPDAIAQAAYLATVQNGGVTINLGGNQPTTGFAYSPSKNTEMIVPEKNFTAQIVDAYKNQHADLLADPNNHLGIWLDNGNYYLDVSRVVAPSVGALQDAMNASQLAGFDLTTHEAVPLAQIVKGVYTPLHEAASHPYLNQGQNLAGNSAGIEQQPGTLQEGSQRTVSRASETVRGPIEALPGKFGLPKRLAKNLANQPVLEPARLIIKREDQLLKLKLRAEARGSKFGLKEGARITREELTKRFKDSQATAQVIRDELVSYIKTELPNEAQGKFITALAQDLTRRQQVKVFERVVRVQEKLAVRKQIERLKKLSQLPGNSIDVKYQKALDQLIENFDLKKPTTKTLRRLNSLKEVLDADTKFKDMHPALVERTQRLLRKPLADMTSAEIKQIGDTADLLVARGEVMLKLKLLQNDRAAKVAIGKVVADTVNIDKKFNPNPKEMTDATKMARGFTQAYMGVLHANRWAQILDDYKYRGQNQRQIGAFAAKENSIIEEGSALKADVLDKLKNIMGEQDITEDMMIRITAKANAEQDQEGIQAANRLLVQHPVEGVKNVGDITLTDQEQQILNVIRDVIKKNLTDRVVATYEALNNKPFVVVKNYFPRIYQAENEVQSPEEAMNRMKFRRKNVEQGFTQERQQGVQKILRHDLLGILSDHIDNALWYTEMQPMLTAWSRVVNSQEYMDAAGKLGVDQWNKYIDAVARKGKSANYQSNYWLKRLRINLSNSQLGFRITSTIAQPFAVFDGMAYAQTNWGGTAALKVLNEVMKTWINPRYADKVINGSSALSQRQGGELAVTESLRDLAEADNKFKKFYGKVAREGFKPLQRADVKTAAGVQQAIQGILEKEGVDDPKTEAEQFMNIVSASSNVTMRPSILATGDLARLWFTFQSFALNRWGVIWEDMIKGGIEKGDIRKKMNAFLGLIILMAGIVAEQKARNGVKQLLGGKGQKQSVLQTLMTAIPSQVPYIGSGLQFFNSFDPDVSPAVLASANSIFKGIKSVVTAKQTSTKIKGAVTAVGNLINLLFGPPGAGQIETFLGSYLSSSPTSSGGGSQASPFTIPNSGGSRADNPFKIPK